MKLALIGQTIFMAITAYMMTPVAAVILLTLAVGIGGFSWAGFSVNMLDMAPQYAGIIMGVSNTFATIPGIVSPSITGYIVQHGSVDEWRIVFFITACFYLFGAIFYAIFASSELQPWSNYEPFVSNTDQADEKQQAIPNESNVAYNSISN